MGATRCSAMARIGDTDPSPAWMRVLPVSRREIFATEAVAPTTVDGKRPVSSKSISASLVREFGTTRSTWEGEACTVPVIAADVTSILLLAALPAFFVAIAGSVAWAKAIGVAVSSGAGGLASAPGSGRRLADASGTLSAECRSASLPVRGIGGGTLADNPHNRLAKSTPCPVDAEFSVPLPTTRPVAGCHPETRCMAIYLAR